MRGEVFSGEGKAAEFLAMEPYAEFMEKFLGEKPFPGTLNLRVDPEEAEKIKQVSKRHRMDPMTYQGRELGGITVFNANIGETDILIVEPDLTRYGDDVIEVVSSEDLRSMLGVEDGDDVKIQHGA